MKKIISIFILLLFVFKLNSQNIETEIKYLKIINLQDKKLINDNLRNAEICAYKLIQNPDSFKTLGAFFYKELAKSYFITENYNLVVLSYLRQRCFFPERKDSEVAKYYNNAIGKIKKSDNKLLTELYKNTELKKIPKSYDKQFQLFLKYLYKLGFKNACKFEILYSDLYRKNNKKSNIPYWISQHNFYTKIGIQSDKKKEFYLFSKIGNKFFIPNFLSKKEKKKICNKALKYYLHFKNKTKVKEYVKFCKENDINYCFRAKFIR